MLFAVSPMYSTRLEMYHAKEWHSLAKLGLNIAECDIALMFGCHLVHRLLVM